MQGRDNRASRADQASSHKSRKKTANINTDKVGERASLISNIGRGELLDLRVLAERLAYLAPKVREHVRGDSVVKVDPNDSVVVAKARAAIKDRYNTGPGTSSTRPAQEMAPTS
jgi:hypothetical protein